MLSKIKFWLWWKFKASDYEKARHQMIFLGAGFMKDNNFIDIKEIYKN
jgi:hypothetical protein